MLESLKSAKLSGIDYVLLLATKVHINEVRILIINLKRPNQCFFHVFDH